MSCCVWLASLSLYIPASLIVILLFAPSPRSSLLVFSSFLLVVHHCPPGGPHAALLPQFASAQLFVHHLLVSHTLPLCLSLSLGSIVHHRSFVFNPPPRPVSFGYLHPASLLPIYPLCRGPPTIHHCSFNIWGPQSLTLSQILKRLWCHGWCRFAHCLLSSFCILPTLLSFPIVHSFIACPGSGNMLAAALLSSSLARFPSRVPLYSPCRHCLSIFLFGRNMGGNERWENIGRYATQTTTPKP